VNLARVSIADLATSVMHMTALGLMLPEDQVWRADVIGTWHGLAETPRLVLDSGGAVSLAICLR